MKHWFLAPLCALTIAGGALAQAPPMGVDGRIEQLRPGEYFWAPEVSPAGPVTSDER